MDIAGKGSGLEIGRRASLRFLLVAEPPFEIFFLAALLFLVYCLLALKHLLASLKKVLLSKGEAATLTGVLLDRGIVAQVSPALQAIIRHSFTCASILKSKGGAEQIKIRLPRDEFSLELPV
jgi:hypothetical protein